MLKGRTETLMERSMPEGCAETLMERSMPKGRRETLLEESMPEGWLKTLLKQSLPNGRIETLMERSMPEGRRETLLEECMPEGLLKTLVKQSLPNGRIETLMERRMPEGWAKACLVERSMPKARTFRRFKKHIKTSRTWRHPPYAEMVQEALVSLSSSSYWPSADLPSTSYECISSYILSKYPLVGEIHQLDHDVLLREAITKLSQKGILYCELTGRYVILPQSSSISAASFRPPPPNIFLPKYYQPPPPSSPPPSPPSPPQYMEEDTQYMEEDTAEERGLALVPVDIKRFILLPTILPDGHIYKEVCNPPPPYPPPLWEVGC